MLTITPAVSHLLSAGHADSANVMETARESMQRAPRMARRRR